MLTLGSRVWRGAVLIAIGLVAASALAQEEIQTQERYGLVERTRLSNLIDKLEFTDRLRISGYANAHYMDHKGVPKFLDSKDLNDPLFQLREFSIFADYNVSGNIVASVELGTSHADQHLLNYGYFDMDVGEMIGPWDADSLGNFSIRAGKFLVPFLSYNENKPNYKQRLMSQPFTAWQMAPVISSPPNYDGLGWSDTGIMLNWNRATGEVGIIDVKLSIIKGLQSDGAVLDSNYGRLDTLVPGPGGSMIYPAVRPRDGLLQNEADGDFNDNNSNKAIVLKTTYRLSVRPIDFGLSWYRGDWDDAGSQSLQMWGAHFNWNERNWTVNAEYVHADVEQAAGLNPVPFPGPPSINLSTGDYGMNAWFVEGSYIPLRYGKHDDRYLRLIARLDDVDTNDEISFTPWDRRRVTFGTEWQFDPNARLRFEWQTSKLDDYSRAPMPYKLAGGKEHIEMFMLSMIFWF